MKQLYTLKDTFHRDLPYTSSSSYINYYAAPDGSGITIPSYVSYIAISSLGTSGAWVKLGASDSAIDIPSSDIVDGTAPLWINPDDRRVAWIEDAEYLYLKSSDAVVVEFWE